MSTDGSGNGAGDDLLLRFRLRRAQQRAQRPAPRGRRRRRLRGLPCAYGSFGLEGETFDVEVRTRHAGTANALLDRVRHRGRAAEKDLALGDVGHELAEMLRREQMVAAGRGVVADDVRQRDAALARERVELVAEDDVVVARRRGRARRCRRRISSSRLRTGVIPIPPAISSAFSRRRAASVKTPNGPSATTRVPGAHVAQCARVVADALHGDPERACRPAPPRARTDAPPTSGRASRESARGRTVRRARSAARAAGRRSAATRRRVPRRRPPRPAARARTSARAARDDPEDDEKRERRDVERAPVVRGDRDRRTARCRSGSGGTSSSAIAAYAVRCTAYHDS